MLSYLIYLTAQQPVRNHKSDREDDGRKYGALPRCS